jgi:hypothetical protein
LYRASCGAAKARMQAGDVLWTVVAPLRAIENGDSFQVTRRGRPQR